MRLLDRVGMDEIVEQWLLAELDSSRFGSRLEELLERDGRDRSALDDPDYRLKLLAEFRHQEPAGINGPIYVDGLPISEIEWWRAVVSREELADVLYIDWDYWLEVTDGSRRPQDFLARLRSRESPYDILEAIATRIVEGPKPRPMILIDSGEGTRTVVLEGHFRLTAHLLAGERGPREIEVLFGSSPLVADWVDY